MLRQKINFREQTGQVLFPFVRGYFANTFFSGASTCHATWRFRVLHAADTITALGPGQSPALNPWRIARSACTDWPTLGTETLKAGRAKIAPTPTGLAKNISKTGAKLSQWAGVGDTQFTPRRPLLTGRWGSQTSGAGALVCLPIIDHQTRISLRTDGTYPKLTQSWSRLGGTDGARLNVEGRED